MLQVVISVDPVVMKRKKLVTKNIDLTKLKQQEQNDKFKDNLELIDTGGIKDMMEFTKIIKETAVNTLG